MIEKLPAATAFRESPLVDFLEIGILVKNRMYSKIWIRAS